MKIKPNYFGIIFGIVVIVSFFMPFTTIRAKGEVLKFSLLDSYDRMMIFALVGVVIVGMIFAAIGRGGYCIVPGALSAALWTYVVTTMAKNRAGIRSSNLVKMIMKNGIGYYMLIAGAVGLILVGVIDIIAKGRQKAEGIVD